ncbi:MAG: DUF385 domain-containing protein [Actinomycetota bacterium]|nr:MAG: DUF385 domain-containing protein [Actinomycetota bacterium]
MGTGLIANGPCERRLKVTLPTKRPLKRRIQVRVMALVNIPMRRVLGLPFATPLGSRLMLLFLTGRKTGKAYRQPVSYVRDGSTLLTPGGGKWKLNLVEGKPVRIRLRGHDVYALPEIVSDLGEIERLLGIIVASNPRATSFIGISRDSSGRFDPAKLGTAVQFGFRVIRWHLDQSI